MEMREFISQITASLREDDTWLVDQYRAKNDKLGLNIWIANGRWFVHLEWAREKRPYGGWGDEVRVNLSLVEKFAIWRAYKKLRKLKRNRVNEKVLESIIERRLS